MSLFFKLSGEGFFIRGCLLGRDSKLDFTHVVDAVMTGNTALQMSLTGVVVRLSAVDNRFIGLKADADLRQANFGGAVLQGADFGGSNLTNASFVKAWLGLADLSKALTEGINLAEAELGGARLRPAPGQVYGRLPPPPRKQRPSLRATLAARSVVKGTAAQLMALVEAQQESHAAATAAADSPPANVTPPQVLAERRAAKATDGAPDRHLAS